MVHSRKPGEVSKEIKVPIEYYKDHLFDIYSPKHITSKNWKLADKAWLHSKGGEVAWFNLYETEFDVPILEFRKRDKNKNTIDHLHMDINKYDVDRVESFIKEVSKAVNKSDTYENGNKWKTAASVWIEGLRPNTRGRITLAKPPQGKLRLLLVRQDRNQNTASTSVEWRKGDASRLENDPLNMLKRSID